MNFLVDPSRWPHREFLARLFGTLGVGAFLVRRIFQMPNLGSISRFYQDFGYTPETSRRIWLLWMAIWVIESGLFLGYIAAYLTRVHAKSVAKGFAEVVFPLVMGAMPFVIVLGTNYNYSTWMPPSEGAHLPVLIGLLGVVILGATINTVGLFMLRRAFTIMTEARTLVRTGLFRFIRHPLYLGQFVSYFAYTLLHLHVVTVALYLTFVIAQVFRARNEERKLAGVFPEYGEYRSKTGMFFPRLLG